MFRSALFLAAMLLIPGPIQAAPAKAAPASKPAAAKPAAKPAPKPPAAAARPQSFDARNPASLIALLASMDAKAQVTRNTDDGVELSVTTPAFSFGAQYVECGPAKVACQAVAFSTVAEKQRANLAQINAFNQTSATCRVFQDQAGKPHVMYSTLLFSTDTREALRTHLGVWQGCLASFGAFLSDPAGYLAQAP